MVLVFSKHKLLLGVLHNQSYKSWGPKLLSSFTDDYKEENEDDTEDTFIATQTHEDIFITGPLNALFPKIIA